MNGTEVIHSGFDDSYQLSFSNNQLSSMYVFIQSRGVCKIYSFKICRTLFGPNTQRTKYDEHLEAKREEHSDTSDTVVSNHIRFRLL